MAQRLTRKLTEVAREVEQQIKAHYNVTSKELDAWRERASKLNNTFPNCTMVDIDDLWIDYEVQRDVLHKHVINIMKKWDPRICSPVSACKIPNNDRIFTYDGQHRTVAAAILHFTYVPCAVVETDDSKKQIIQIKGKENKAPVEKYQPACIDFVAQSMMHGYTVVADGENIGMVKHDEEYHFDDLELLPAEYRDKPVFRKWVDVIFPTIIFPKQQKAFRDLQARIVEV